MQAYRGICGSRLLSFQLIRESIAAAISKRNTASISAALSEVLQCIKKRTLARLHQRCLRVTRKKVPSPVVAFAKLKQRRRAAPVPQRSETEHHNHHDEVLRPPAHVEHDGDDRPQEAAHRAGVAAGARAHARVRRSGLPVYETMRAAQRLAVTQRVTSAPHKHVPRRRTAARRPSTRY